MEAKHSKGPWDDRLANQGTILIFSADNEVIGCASNVPPMGQARINARLIAAAPELLAALERLLIWRQKTTPFDLLEQVEAVIAKARGEV